MLQLKVLSFPSSNFTFVTSLDTTFSLYSVLFTEQLSTEFLAWQVYLPTSFSETSFSIIVLEENRVIPWHSMLGSSQIFSLPSFSHLTLVNSCNTGSIYINYLKCSDVKENIPFMKSMFPQFKIGFAFTLITYIYITWKSKRFPLFIFFVIGRWFKITTLPNL